MSKDSDSIQHAGNVELNAVTTNLPSFGTIVEAIFAEGTDYMKKSVETRMAFVEKLLGAKSLDTVIQIQSEYAKTSHADFVAQGTKMGELYSNLAKACFKPRSDLANLSLPISCLDDRQPLERLNRA